MSIHKYKVWVEVEEVEDDEFYDDIDSIFVTEFVTKEEAIAFANKIVDGVNDGKNASK